jgi:hypothetical protein
METELAQRENDGIAVTLVWHQGTDRLTVKVRDERNGDSFDLAPTRGTRWMSSTIHTRTPRDAAHSGRDSLAARDPETRPARRQTP